MEQHASTRFCASPPNSPVREKSLKLLQRFLRSIPGRVSLLTTLSAIPCAHAQRVDENAVEQAQDAFGITVGLESIGLYSPNDARGFSPRQAGNLVIEGLYFDQQTFQPSSRIIQSSTLHVGLSAQSYPFAAPTGVVDYQLRLPGDRQLTSIVAGLGPHDQAFGEIDAQIPLSEQLGLGLGLGYRFRPSYFNAEDSAGPSAGTILRWRPTSRSQIVTFGGWSATYEKRERPLVFLGGPHLPPAFEQAKLAGQDWTQWNQEHFDYGLLGHVSFGSGWTLRAGGFSSARTQKNSFNESLYNAQPDGTAEYVIAALPEQKFASTSGEVRLSRVLNIEDRQRHTVHLIGRTREGSRRYGGDDQRFFGTTRIGERLIVPEPVFSTGPMQRTENRQTNYGAAYAGLWDGMGEISAGVQRAQIERIVQDGPGSPPLRTSEATWLYNGTFAAYLPGRLTLFGSYSRGLEESGIAPENAVNRRQAAPLTLSKQIDAGLRYVVRDNLSFVLAGFEIEKPYYGLTSQNLFTELGLVRHRGVEASLTGELIEDLDVVAGVVHIDPRLSGASVDDGSIGKTPVGPIPDVISVDISYSPASWHGFSLEASLRDTSSRVASRDNTLVVAGATEVDAGFRYKFQVGRARSSIRFQAMNLTDKRAWEIEPSGQARLSDERRYSLAVTADL